MCLSCLNMRFTPLRVSFFSVFLSVFSFFKLASLQASHAVIDTSFRGTSSYQYIMQANTAAALLSGISPPQVCSVGLENADMATGILKVLRSCDTHDSVVLSPALQAWQGSGRLLLLLLLLFLPFCFSGLRAGSGTGLAVHIHWTVLFWDCWCSSKLQESLCLLLQPGPACREIYVV